MKKKNDYNDFLDKIRCTDDFRKKMQERLSASAQEFYEYEEVMTAERVPRHNIGRMVSAAAAFLIVCGAVGGGIYGLRCFENSQQSADNTESIVTEEAAVPIENNLSEEDIIAIFDEVLPDGEKVFRPDDGQYAPKLFYNISNYDELKKNVAAFEWVDDSTEKNFYWRDFYILGNTVLTRYGYILRNDKIYRLKYEEDREKFAQTLDNYLIMDDYCRLAWQLDDKSHNVKNIMADIKFNSGDEKEKEYIGKISEDRENDIIYIQAYHTDSESGRETEVTILFADSVGTWTEKDRETGKIINTGRSDILEEMPVMSYSTAVKKAVEELVEFAYTPEEEREFFNDGNLHILDGSGRTTTEIAENNGVLEWYGEPENKMYVSYENIEVDSPDFNLPDINELKKSVSE